MADLAQLLSGVADLAWPVVAVIALVIFKDDIRSLLARLRKGKVLGQEVELDPELDRLEKKVEEARTEVSERLEGAPDDKESPAKEDRAGKILEEAAVSPAAGLMALARDIERHLRQLVAALPFEIDYSRKPLLPLLTELQKKSGGVVPPDLFESIRDFWTVRSRVVHGKAASEREILRAIDIGLGLLDALLSYPHERHFIDAVDIPLFEDEGCTRRRPDVWGVLLSSVPTQAPQDRTERIFPTTKVGHYKVGRAVSWEWNPEHKWGETWYRDQNTQEVRYAWTGSAEFAGRHLEDI